MRKQRGGSVLKNGTTLTAQQILDKFSATFFDKHNITIDNSLYRTLAPFVHFSLKNQEFAWFDKSKGLVLEDSLINYDSIESMIFHHLIQEGKNIEGDPLMSFPLSMYAIVLPTGNLIPANHPYLRKMGKAASNAKKEKFVWRLFAKDVTGAEIDTGIEKQTITFREAVYEVITQNIQLKTSNVEFVSQIMGSSAGEGFRINDEDISLFERMPKSKKLIYSLHGNTLNIYYAEQDSSDPTKIFFHPFNFRNFLPQSSIQKKFIGLFRTIQDKLNALFGDCYKYELEPDKFFHIHVANIKNEPDILLTIHAAYETMASRQDDGTKKYTYKNVEGVKKKQEKIYYPPDRISINSPNAGDEEKLYQYYRRRHNAYLLLKPSGDVHPFYVLSNRSQVGNPFFFSSKMLYDERGTGFALYDSLFFGETLFDLNHVSKKGVMLGMYSSSMTKCAALCPDPGQPEFNETILNLLTDGDAPITPDELNTRLAAATAAAADVPADVAAADIDNAPVVALTRNQRIQRLIELRPEFAEVASFIVNANPGLTPEGISAQLGGRRRNKTTKLRRRARRTIRKQRK